MLEYTNITLKEYTTNYIIYNHYIHSGYFRWQDDGLKHLVFSS